MAFGAGTPLTVAGAATDRRSLPCSLFTLFGRGTVHDGCPSFAKACQIAIGRVGETWSCADRFRDDREGTSVEISRAREIARPRSFELDILDAWQSQRIGDLRGCPGKSAVLLDAEKHMRGPPAIRNEHGSRSPPSSRGSRAD